jgi:hypothetical protein
MEKSNALQIINSRKLIAQPAVVQLKCTSITPFDGKFIANFNAMTGYHVDEAKKHLANGEYQEAVNQSLSASLRATDYLPSKGEVVKVIVEEITTGNGIKGLFVTSVSELKAATIGKVSILDEAVPATQDAKLVGNYQN